MNTDEVESQLARIAALPALERAAAAEELEAGIRAALNEIAPDRRPA